MLVILLFFDEKTNFLVLVFYKPILIPITMKQFICVIALVGLMLCAHVDSQAQTYETAIGLRLGSPTSVTVKHFLNDSHALEGYVGYRGWSGYNWFHVSGAYLIHNQIEDIDNFLWYFGGGATVFFWNYDSDFLRGNEWNSTSLGIQGYLGLDYSFDDVPINLSVDWVPTIFVGSAFTSGFGAGYGALAVRYTLN